METQPSELTADFKWITLFHAGLAELCVYRVDSINRQERDNEHVFRCLMTEWTRSAQSFCLKDSFELGITEQVVEDLFVQCFYRRRDEGAFIICMKCLLALQNVSPSIQQMGREKLKEVWEEVRRSVFKTSVEQGDWAVVKAMSDHSLYDDQRGWATVQALDHQQWDVVLALSQHGMTDDQLYRIHRQFAKRADWPAVLKLFESGADLTHVKEDLEMANVGRDRPPKPEVLSEYKKKIQQLRNLERRVTREAESLNFAVKQNNWRAVLFRLRQRSSQRQRAKVLQMAIQRQAWHVVHFLVRMGLSQQDRDILFLQCISQSQWGIARLLMEKLVNPIYCKASVDIMLKERQWILVAMVMDLNYDDVRRKQIMQRAMEAKEGSVVSHGIMLLEGRLSEEERRRLFHKAHTHLLWQVLLKLAEVKDEAGLRHRDITLREAVWRRQWEVVTHCQQCGADIDARKEGGDTLLHKAARECDWEIVQGLIQQGADRNLTDSTGNRVIHRALDVLHWETVRLLVLFHADLNFPDPNGHNVLYRLIESTVPSRCVFVPTPTADQQGQIIDISLLWSCGVDYGETYGGKNALHVTSQAGLPDTFRFLVARGSNPLARTEDGQTVLWMAAENRQCPRQMVAGCLKLGVSTFEQESNQDNFQSSPFALSILRQDVVLMSMLYESGSCTNREVFWHYNNALTLFTRQRSFPRRNRVRSGRMTFNSPALLALLTRMATQPRTLKSLCRLVISHHVGVRKKRAKRVAQLPVSDAVKDFVMFRDVVDPLFAQAVEESLT